MSEAQKRLRELLDQQSKDRQRGIELSRETTLTAETRTELDAIETRAGDTERLIRAARLAVDSEDDEARRAGASGADGLDAEARERVELRSKASLGLYLVAALRGRAVGGAEAELQAAAGVDGIPTELWDTQPVLEARARRDAGVERRDTSPAPSTVGINLDPIRPAVFAPSIADVLGIEMPQVESGTFATATVTTSVTGDAVARGADVPETAAALTVGSTSPKRVGASLALTLEDIAQIGQANFESALRENTSLSMSDALDDQVINGDGSSDDLIGIFKRLTDPDAPAADVETWARFVAVQSGGVDGLWASKLSHIAMLVGVESYRLACSTFQGVDAEQSAAAYLQEMGDSFATNARMPAKANDIQQGIIYRRGRAGMRTAVCPHWAEVTIDDIYTGARKGERYFTLSALVGDVLIVQPGAYQQIAFRVS